MKLLTTALLAASAFAVVAPAANAQSYGYNDCEAERGGRQVAGAIIGGILGAVIGNELADDSNNQPDYRRGGRGHRNDYRGRNNRHDRYYDRRNDRGNAEDVGTLAGAGVGALIGAGIAGGGDCGNQPRTARYDDYSGKPGAGGYTDDRYQDQGYGGYAGNSYQDQGYDGYPTQAYRDDGSDYGYVEGYDTHSSTQLLGGSQPGPDARIYETGAQDWNCQWTSTRRMGEYGQAVMEQVYMCQGADNIWRPYDSIVQ